MTLALNNPRRLYAIKQRNQTNVILLLLYFRLVNISLSFSLFLIYSRFTLKKDVINNAFYIHFCSYQLPDFPSSRSFPFNGECHRIFHDYHNANQTQQSTAEEFGTKQGNNNNNNNSNNDDDDDNDD